MDENTARLLGIIGQLIVGLAILLVVWMLSRTSPPTSARALRTGWFVVAILGLAVVILAAVRLPTVL